MAYLSSKYDKRFVRKMARISFLLSEYQYQYQYEAKYCEVSHAYKIKCTDQSPCWKLIVSLANQQIQPCLWNSKFHYFVRESILSCIRWVKFTS